MRSCEYNIHVNLMTTDNLVHNPRHTTENHVVLYTYKPITDRVTHNGILYEVEVRFSSFLL